MLDLVTFAYEAKKDGVRIATVEGSRGFGHGCWAIGLQRAGFWGTGVKPGASSHGLGFPPAFRSSPRRVVLNFVFIRVRFPQTHATLDGV
jgi:hypothetical protein